MLFTKSYCPYCIKASGLFTKLGAAFKELQLDKMENGKEIQDELLTVTGQKTVPNIFIQGKHIGGCDSLFKLYEEGKLQDLSK